MRPWIGALLALLPTVLSAQVLFQEDFEQGHDPFDFSAAHPSTTTNPFEAAAAAGGPERSRVWAIRFQAPGRGYFGHRLRLGAVPADTVYWAAYVKFGHRDQAPEWSGDYEVRFPLFDGDDQGRGPVMGRFLPWGDDGFRARFELVLSDGSRHPVLDQSLVSNRWYLVQFALEDRGMADRVRIWINNDDPLQPNYDYVGGDMIGAWGPELVVDHGYRTGGGAGAVFYYDQVTLATDFVDLPLPNQLPPPPSAPGKLRVE